MRTVAALFASFFLLCGCDPNVEFRNIDTNQLISISCFISPQDTTFIAYIFRASPAGSTVKRDSAAVKDAQVTISDGENYDTLFLTVSMDPNSNQNVYKYTGVRKQLSVSANSIYFIDVKAPGGIHATASCTIPPAPENLKVNGNRVDDDYHFSLEWSNPSRLKYFSLVLESEGSYENPFPGGTGKVDLKALLNEDIVYPSDKQVLHNRYEGTLPYAYRAENPSLTVSVRNIDDNLYKYFKSYQQFETWNSNNSGSLVPNFKDAPQIHSNVTGGVGIFGGYNTSSLKVEL